MRKMSTWLSVAALAIVTLAISYLNTGGAG
jgi:hypothetical protein